MEKNLLILLFLTGVATSGPRKYYLIQQLKTWTDAQIYCRTYHVDLATIETPADMMLVTAITTKYNVYSNWVWVGLYNQINSWRWSLGNVAVGNFTNWASGQPDNGGGNEECGDLRPGGVWNDAPCALAFPFICFDDRFTGSSSYIYISTYKSWFDAQTYCRRFHTDLASARTSTEASILTGRISGGTWFGLSRKGWIWSDQTNATNSPWWPGQPDNYNGNENCGYIIQNKFYDYYCTLSMWFFCHRFITGQQQILRMKVQSNQDVNDPAVMAALLVQIQQKLMDHGVTNVKVTFRKQPDGLKFHKTVNYT